MNWRTFWNFLPPFLRRIDPLDDPEAANSPQEALCKAIGGETEDMAEDIGLLKIRGAAHRVSGNAEYYASDDRKRDLSLIGIGYGLKRRSTESWEEYEVRLQNYPFVVRRAGTKAIIIMEIERTGVDVSRFVELNLDDKRWILLSLEDQGEETEENISHIFGKDEEPDPDVRWTRIYEFGGDLFSFFVELSGAPYSKGELSTIIMMTKPAFTRCYLKYPDGEVEVLE